MTREELFHFMDDDFFMGSIRNILGYVGVICDSIQNFDISDEQIRQMLNILNFKIEKLHADLWCIRTEWR